VWRSSFRARASNARPIAAHRIRLFHHRGRKLPDALIRVDVQTQARAGTLRVLSADQVDRAAPAVVVAQQLGIRGALISARPSTAGSADRASIAPARVMAERLASANGARPPVNPGPRTISRWATPSPPSPHVRPATALCTPPPRARRRRPRGRRPDPDRSTPPARPRISNPPTPRSIGLPASTATAPRVSSAGTRSCGGQ
jgi:hypothetical protein